MNVLASAIVSQCTPHDTVPHARPAVSMVQHVADRSSIVDPRSARHDRMLPTASARTNSQTASPRPRRGALRADPEAVYSDLSTMPWKSWDALLISSGIVRMASRDSCGLAPSPPAWRILVNEYILYTITSPNGWTHLTKVCPGSLQGRISLEPGCGADKTDCPWDLVSRGLQCRCCDLKGRKMGRKSLIWPATSIVCSTIIATGVYLGFKGRQGSSQPADYHASSSAGQAASGRGTDRNTPAADDAIVYVTRTGA